MTTNEIIASIDEEIERLKRAQALLAVDAVPAPRGPGRPKGGRRTLSTEARAKIAAAQRKRWAKQKRKS